MISDRKILAIKLRSQGLSIKEISKRLDAAQSSVSIWTRGVVLTSEQISQLAKNTHLPEVVEKRRQSRLNSELVKRNTLIAQAKQDITEISQRELWLMGVCLYWAEGSKTKSSVEFANGDPNMIILMLRFFRQICKVPEEKLHAHIHIHEHLETAIAEKYWQNVTQIPGSRFYKTYNKPNKSSKGLRNSLPHGVCSIYVHDFKLLLKIKGWIAGIYETSNLQV